MVRECMRNVPRVKIVAFDGLLVDFYRAQEATAVIRGLRSESDFRFEAELAAANKLMYPEFEMVLLPGRSDLTFTSSSMVREVASFGGNISNMVPEEIRSFVSAHFQRKGKEDGSHA